jgi:hypothetical protein
MDLLFGTYRCPNHEPAAFGLRHPEPRTYVGLLIGPLLPRMRFRSAGGLPAPSPANREESVVLSM